MSRFYAFAVYNSSGAPMPTAAPSFVVYKGRDGGSRTPPVITNRGGGVFSFSISTADVAFGVAYLIGCGAGASPPYFVGTDGGQVQAFALYDLTGAPDPGQSPMFSTYVSAGGSALAPPLISDFGSGLYVFAPALADYVTGVAFEINCGSGVQPAHVHGFAQQGDQTPASPIIPIPQVAPQVSPDADAYARLLRQLLPPGRLWKLEPDGWMWKTLQALADELARVSNRGDALMLETLPDTAFETLPDWERVLGLPDSCMTTIPTSISERQIAAAAKYAAQGGQTFDYFIEVAETLGYTATASTYAVCRSGSAHSGDPIYNEAWAYAWLMTISGHATGGVSIALSGSAHSGDRIQGFGVLDIECVIKRIAPAHTIPLFAYTL